MTTSAPDLSAEQQSAIDTMFDQLDTGTHYGLLALEVDCDRDDVQKAYYRLSRQWHPDRFFRKDIGEYADRIEMVFVGITQAYQTLRDETKRKTYDRELRDAGTYPSKRKSSLRTPPPRSETQAVESPAAPPAARSPDRPPVRPGSIRERLEKRKRQAPRAPSNRVRNKVEARVRAQLKTQLGKAATLFKQGKADYEAGKIIKAASALELACHFDPHNEEYRELLGLAKEQSRTVRINQLILMGEQAESYQQYKQAISSYRSAVELDPEDGRVYYRLARLVRHEEANDREALNLMREAVARDPDMLDYRMSLGDLYRELGLRLNAKREYQEVLKRDKTHEAAKAGLKEL